MNGQALARAILLGVCLVLFLGSCRDSDPEKNLAILPPKPIATPRPAASGFQQDDSPPSDPKEASLPKPSRALTVIHRLDPLPAELRARVVEKAQSVFLDRLVDSPALAEAVRDNGSLLGFEEVRSEFLDTCLPDHRLIRITLRRRSPDRALLLLDPENRTWDLSRETDTFLSRLPGPKDEAVALQRARLYVVLTSLSTTVVFPEIPTDIPVPQSKGKGYRSAETYRNAFRPPEIREVDEKWTVELLSWERLQGKLRKWEVSIATGSNRFDATSKEIAQRIGDYVTADF